MVARKLTAHSARAYSDVKFVVVVIVVVVVVVVVDVLVVELMSFNWRSAANAIGDKSLNVHAQFVDAPLVMVATLSGSAVGLVCAGVALSRARPRATTDLCHRI